MKAKRHTLMNMLTIAAEEYANAAKMTADSEWWPREMERLNLKALTLRDEIEQADTIELED